MQSHYIGSNVPGTSEECCPECSLVLPTKCSLGAHLRTHSMKRPFICPDCARKYSNLNGFFHHLKSECYHFAKSEAFYCPSCHQLFKTSVPLEVKFNIIKRETYNNFDKRIDEWLHRFHKKKK